MNKIFNNITVIDGVEGSGKTLFMTANNIAFARSGGKLFTFPGYKVLDAHGNQISEEITLDKIMELLVQEKLHDMRIAIDEMQNWLDAYNSRSTIADLMVAIGQQRRKFELSMIGTINPHWLWLPKRIRELTHIRIHAEDMSRKLRHLTPGTSIKLTYYDNMGFITGTPGRKLRPKPFRNASKYWKHYDTYAPIDIMNKYTRMKINKQVIEVDFNNDGQSDGEFVPNPDGIYIPKNGNGVEAAAAYVFNSFLKEGITKVNRKAAIDSVLAQGVNATRQKVGVHIPPGWKYVNNWLNGQRGYYEYEHGDEIDVYP